MLKDVQVGLREAFTIFQVNAQNVDATLTEPTNPGDLYPVADVSREGRMRKLSNANTRSGKNGIPSRPMVLGNLMGGREGRIPPKAASLSLAASIDVSERILVSG